MCIRNNISCCAKIAQQRIPARKYMASVAADVKKDKNRLGRQAMLQNNNKRMNGQAPIHLTISNVFAVLQNPISKTKMGNHVIMRAIKNQGS